MPDALDRFRAGAAAGEREMSDELQQRLMALPPIQAAEGYRARVLVPPGTLWDPLAACPGDGDDIWIGDDGGELGEGQGNVYRVTIDGVVSHLVPPGQLTAPIGVDRAPAGFGAYGGQVFG